MSVSMREYLGETLYQEYLTNKEYLKQISFYVLPNKPSAMGYSAADIRRKSYEPDLQLYDWLYRVKRDVSNITYDVDNLGKIRHYELEIVSAQPNFEIVVTNSVVQPVENYESELNAKQLVLSATIGNKHYVFADCSVIKVNSKYFIVGTGFNITDETVANMSVVLDTQEMKITGEIEEPNNLKELVNDINTRLTEVESESVLLDLTHTASFTTADLSNLRENGGIVVVEGDETLENSPKLILGQNPPSQGEGAIINKGQKVLVLGG